MSSDDVYKTTMTWIIYFDRLIECANTNSRIFIRRKRKQVKKTQQQMTFLTDSQINS